MKATGTKTDSNTKVIARMGPVISLIAFLQASGMERLGSCSITRSIFSTTTIASSTTMPMASTSANNEMVLAEYPINRSTAKVPMTDTGTAANGMSVVRSLPRNRKTTRATRTIATTRVRMTSIIVDVTNTVLSQKTARFQWAGNRVDSVC